MDYRRTAYKRRWWTDINRAGTLAQAFIRKYFRAERRHLSGDRIVAVWVPIRFILCTTCEGRGSYVNPNLDSNGITPEEMDKWGSSFQEDYANGVYNVACGHCKGAKAIPYPIYQEDIQLLKTQGNLEEEEEYDAAWESESMLREMGG